MSDFQAILVEGLFYLRDDGSLFIEQDDGEHVSWDDTMAPVVGQHVQLAVHHLPPNGVEPDKPGAGSCQWPAGVGCPVKHDQFPDRLLSFHMEGVLSGSPWLMRKLDGTSFDIPWRGMPGHYGRVGAATIIDVEKMREQLAGLTPEALAATGVNVADLEIMLDRLRKAGQ